VCWEAAHHTASLVRSGMHARQTRNEFCSCHATFLNWT